MNKKIALGCCVCIVLIVIVIILFFKPTSEYNLADITDNLYNIFQTRQKSIPWNIEYQSIYSLFDPEFVNYVKQKIKERIKVNIPNYIEWSLNTPQSTLNMYLTLYILQKSEDWSEENIFKQIKKPIIEDQRFSVCASDPRYPPNWCLMRMDGGGYSDDIYFAADHHGSPNWFMFTKNKQLK